MGLSPKNNLNDSNYGWDHLDSILKANIVHTGDTATIRISDYSLTKEEILSEATKNGYTCKLSDDGKFIYFE